MRNNGVACCLACLLAGVACAAVESRYFPVSTTNAALEVVVHQDYALGYCEDWEIAAWVAEQLTPSMFEQKYERSSGFRSDPLVSTGSAVSSDYTNSGYDRGHLAAAADFAYDETAMYESFYLSNMTPQTPNLNRGVWSSLEEWVREAATREMSLLVISGPVITGEVTRIGKNGVAVPHGYYKALCDLTPPQKMIGFLYANQAGESKDLADHAVTIDTIEQLTGLDLFAALSNETLEATCNLNAWTESPQPTTGFILIVR